MDDKKDENYSIVVGISRYRSPQDYPPLDGPLNDVDHICEWLSDPNGGNVKPANIYPLTTPARLISPAGDVNPGELAWTPDQAAFIRAYQDITIEAGQYVHRNSRLYLYFSGHGFSQSADTTARAALFAANAYGPARPNIPGTVYAEAAKRVALFKEIVLIMDCCRDVQRNSPYAAYELDQTESGNAEKVKLFAMYASGKNGKAQEREFKSQEKVFGLLTHGLVKALDEAPTNVLGQVSSTTLNNYLKIYWPEWCPKDYPAPQPPRTVPADSGDIFFGSRKELFAQRFVVDSNATAVKLQSQHLDAVGMLGPDCITWAERNDPSPIEIRFDVANGEKHFALKLPRGEHTLTISGSPERDLIFKPEVQNDVRI
jgi:hypothetical protein